MQKQLEAARQQMGQPFIYEEELSEKSCYPDGDQHKAGVRVFAGTGKRGGFRWRMENDLIARKLNLLTVFFPALAPSYKEIILNSLTSIRC